jgi:hypothetical protein
VENSPRFDGRSPLQIAIKRKGFFTANCLVQEESFERKGPNGTVRPTLPHFRMSVPYVTPFSGKCALRYPIFGYVRPDFGYVRPTLPPVPLMWLY